MISKLFSLAVATALAAIPAAAHAGTAPDQGHQQLIDAVQQAGIEVVYDGGLCNNAKFEGFYSNKGTLGICLRGRGWGPEVLDTLRHEAQHMVQDCLGDGKPNFQFNGRYLTFQDPIEFALSTGMTEREVQGIYMTYGSLGYDESDILMEVEAWAVARSVPPELIAQAVQTQCKAR